MCCACCRLEPKARAADGMDEPHPDPPLQGGSLTPARWHREISQTLNFGHRKQEQGAAFLGGLSSPLRVAKID